MYSYKFLDIGFNPYSPGFSIYLKKYMTEIVSARVLQSLFTWIFYLFVEFLAQELKMPKLQSLFTWIFYLFKYILIENVPRYLASILIHLDFLSIFTLTDPTPSIDNASILIHLDFLSI